MASKKMCSDYISNVFNILRSKINDMNINKNRLPQWFHCAKIQCGVVNNTNVFIINGINNNNDDFVYKKCIRSDTELYFNKKFEKSLSWFHPLDKEGNSCDTISSYGPEDSSAPIFNIDPMSSFVQPIKNRPHQMLLVFDICLRLIVDKSPIMTRMIDLSIYVHDKDIHNKNIPDVLINNMLISLKNFYDSSKGDKILNKKITEQAFFVSKENNIIILGNYTDHHKDELYSIKDYINNNYNKYSAYLIEEISEINAASIDEKVKLWGQSSRFCIMIDIHPSGHIAEYKVLKSSDVVLALIRPENAGSTYMIGNDEVNRNHIKTFHFMKSPLEVIDDAIKWAEEIVENRIKNYNEIYDWRKP